MGLPHVVEAIAIVKKRKEDREAALVAAEELCRRCALSETVEEGTAEKMADAIEALGLETGVWYVEAQITALLATWFGELDELEVQYREAVADLQERAAHYRKHPVVMGSMDEYRKKSHLRQLDDAVEHFRAAHEGKRLLMNSRLHKARYPRVIPPRYRVSIEYLTENYSASTRDPKSGEIILGKLLRDWPAERAASQQSTNATAQTADSSGNVGIESGQNAVAIND